MFGMENIVERSRKLLEAYAEKAAHKRMAHLELLAQAFLQETGLNPSQIELVEDRKDPSVIRWYYRKKETE